MTASSNSAHNDPPATPSPGPSPQQPLWHDRILGVLVIAGMLTLLALIVWLAHFGAVKMSTGG